MTWLGKILAVLNIVATLAFVYLAFQDFAKREAWAYANYVHDVAVNGLPLDDKVTDDREEVRCFTSWPTTPRRSGSGATAPWRRRWKK